MAKKQNDTEDNDYEDKSFESEGQTVNYKTSTVEQEKTEE
jgi:hypothetical protein